jgi:hypothetical protein
LAAPLGGTRARARLHVILEVTARLVALRPRGTAGALIGRVGAAGVLGAAAALIHPAEEAGAAGALVRRAGVATLAGRHVGRLHGLVATLRARATCKLLRIAESLRRPVVLAALRALQIADDAPAGGGLVQRGRHDRRVHRQCAQIQGTHAHGVVHALGGARGSLAAAGVADPACYSKCL